MSIKICTRRSTKNRSNNCWLIRRRHYSKNVFILFSCFRKFVFNIVIIIFIFLILFFFLEVTFESLFIYFFFLHTGMYQLVCY
jgi:hypothetical protein